MSEAAPVEPKPSDPLPTRSPRQPHLTAAAPLAGPLRERVLQATDALVRATGEVDGITMRSLAKRSGTSTTALYSVFPSKRVLFTVARRRALVELREHLDAALRCDDTSVALRTWVECYASRGYANPWVAGLLTTDPRSLALDELLEAADLIGLSGLRRLLGEVCSRGELAPGVSPALAAWLLWAGAHSLLVLRDVVAEHDDGAVHGPRIRCLAAAVVGGIIAKASPSP